MAQDWRDLFAALKAEAARYTPGAPANRPDKRADSDRQRRERIAAEIGERPWLDGVKEICLYCGFSEFAFRVYRRRGLPVRKFEGRIVALPADLDRWMIGRNFKRGRPRKSGKRSKGKTKCPGR